MRVLAVLVGYAGIQSQAWQLAHPRGSSSSDTSPSRWPLNKRERMLSWLEGRVGLNPKEAMEVVTKCPRAYTIDIDDEQVEERLLWFRDRLGLDSRGTTALIKRDPQFLLYNLDLLESKMKWFETEVGDLELAQKILSSNSRLFSASLSHTLKPKVRWLQDKLQLPREEALSLLLSYPELFGASADTNLGPTIDFFVEDMGATLEDLRKAMMEGTGRVLASSLSGRLRPRVELLRSVGINPSFNDHWKILVMATEAKFRRWFLGMGPAQKVPGVSRGKCGNDNVEDRVGWLQDKLQATWEETLNLLLARPTLLTINRDRELGPRIDFFLEDMGAKPEELRVAIEECSQVLKVSFNGRLRPRLNVLRNVGIEPCFKDHWRILVTATEANFQRWISELGPAEGIIEALQGEKPDTGAIESRLEDRLEWLQAKLEFTEEEAADQLKLCPVLLSLNVDTNLGPTTDFFLEDFGATLEELRMAMKKHKFLLTFSLNRRLRPRLELMQSVGIKPSFKDHWRMLTEPEHRFRRWLCIHGTAELTGV
ncbi:unnamed protein product [Choristocarpus tenellus]